MIAMYVLCTYIAILLYFSYCPYIFVCNFNLIVYTIRYRMVNVCFADYFVSCISQLSHIIRKLCVNVQLQCIKLFSNVGF